MEDGSLAEDLQRGFATLMQRVREGSQDAARELIDSYGSHLLTVIRRKLHNKLRARFDSVDFTQDVWCSFFANHVRKPTFSSPEELIGFLVQLAHHRVIEEYRTQFETQKRGLNREHSIQGSAALEAQRLAGRHPTPSQAMVAKETWDQLFKDQPSHYQRILVLASEGRAPKEIAATIGLTERSVRRILDKLEP